MLRQSLGEVGEVRPWVVVGTKAMHVRAAAESRAASAWARDGRVPEPLNGLGSPEVVAEVVGEECRGWASAASCGRRPRPTCNHHGMELVRLWRAARAGEPARRADRRLRAAPRPGSPCTEDDVEPDWSGKSRPATSCFSRTVLIVPRADLIGDLPDDPHGVVDRSECAARGVRRWRCLLDPFGSTDPGGRMRPRLGLAGGSATAALACSSTGWPVGRRDRRHQRRHNTARSSRSGSRRP